MQKNTFVNLWQKNYFFEWKILFFIVKFLIGILFLKLNLNDSIHDKIKNHNLLVHGWYSPKGLRDMSSSSHNFIFEQKSIFSFYFIYSMIGARKYTLHHDFKSKGRFQEMAYRFIRGRCCKGFKFRPGSPTHALSSTWSLKNLGGIYHVGCSNYFHVQTVIYTYSLYSFLGGQWYGVWNLSDQLFQLMRRIIAHIQLPCIHVSTSLNRLDESNAWKPNIHPFSHKKP